MGVRIQGEVIALKEPTHPSLLLLLARSSLDRIPAVGEIPSTVHFTETAAPENLQSPGWPWGVSVSQSILRGSGAAEGTGKLGNTRG